MQRYEKIVNFYVSLLNYMRIKQAEKVNTLSVGTHSGYIKIR